MVLSIDIGNTNIVFGISEQDNWLKIWRIQTDWSKTADEYEVIFRSLFTSSEIDKSEITKTIFSSVVPSLIRPFSEMLVQMLDHSPVLVEPSIYSKLPVEVLNPYEIGTDIVADATAAYIRYGGPCMVIDFGTALTFTTISQTGKILGVAIAPGLLTALKSLTGNTAQLPDVQLVAPPSVLGENTIHAIQAGLVMGFAGLVDSIVCRTEEELGLKLAVIATGGLSSVLQNVSSKIQITDENLTLDGLKYMAKHF
ncbi:MAG TPA: type III pantothenate kinase [Prolixibacteraceae bacterium]|nr:type III pantothenate kinase [Prolixibacteraceae bacterium]